MSLKINDKVYEVVYQRWTNNKQINVATVERLTKTQAVLSNGEKLINEKTVDWNNKECFSEYGNRGSKWYILTDDINYEIQKLREKNRIKQWFTERKFNDEEMKIIYLHFKSLDLLKPKV